MIVTEYHSTRSDGVRLFITYSDADHYIIQDQTGIQYESAIDVEHKGYTYTESDELIVHEPEPELPEGFPVPQPEQSGEEEDPDEVTPEEVMEALEELL